MNILQESSLDRLWFIERPGDYLTKEQAERLVYKFESQFGRPMLESEAVPLFRQIDEAYRLIDATEKVCAGNGILIPPTVNEIRGPSWLRMWATYLYESEIPDCFGAERDLYEETLRLERLHG